MKKQIYKIILLIFSISLFLGTSVNFTEAFLDSDLGLNLYKELDKGLEDFEEKMYVYELSEQEKQDISKSINKILFNKGIGECLIEGISPGIVEEIVNGNIKIVTENMKPECYNPETGEYSNKKIGNIINELGKIKAYYLSKSKTKAKAIHEISRVGMYSDGNTDNSPFDIIKDLNDINAIIFTEEMEYEYEDYDFLKKYKQDKPLIGPLGFELGGENGGGSNGGTSNGGTSNGGTSNGGGSNGGTSNGGGSNGGGSNGGGSNGGGSNGGTTYTNTEETPDGNSYICPSDSDNSGLDETSLEGLVVSIDPNHNGGNSGVGYVFNYGNGTSGHIPLPETNAIPPVDLASSEFASESIENGVSPYEKITDNDIWNCSEYFCIITEFIVRNQQALDYGVSHSIQNIIERSNKHLKKSANTSLVQSKMTTNNFEISLRDLNLPDMFHLGINLSFKSPPILNLENLPGNPEKNSREEVKNMLRKKYKNMGLNYENPNNLNKFSYALKKIKQIFLTSENASNYYNGIDQNLINTLNLRSKILNYNKEVVHKNINNDILEDFDKQFTEISQFNVNIMDYIYNLDILIKKLKEIPTYSG